MNTETLLTLGYVGMALLVSLLSVWIGYRLVNSHSRSVNSILHQLEDEFTSVAYLQEGWTSKEIASLSTLLISSHLTDKHDRKVPTVQDKSYKVQAKPDLVFWINEN